MADGVSFILPCFNKEQNIEMTIESLENQTLVKNNPADFIEIICIDDYSTDKTVKILNKLQKKYNNIVIIQNPENMGVFATRLNGINAATKKHISFIDPDDYADETFYEELYTAAVKSNADITQTPSVIKEYGKYLTMSARTWYPRMPEGIINVSPQTFTDILGGNWLTMWNRVFKAEKIKKIAAYPPYYINFLEDILIYISTLVISDTVCNVKTKGCYHYNLSNDVEHLSKKKGKKDRAIPTSQVFQLLDSFLLESGNMQYFDYVVRFRRSYVNSFCDEYAKSFNIERFGKNNNYDDIRQSEREYVHRLYTEMFKSIF